MLKFVFYTDNPEKYVIISIVIQQDLCTSLYFQVLKYYIHVL